MIFSILFANGQVIDARMARAHQPSLVEFPIFVSVRAVPLTRVIVPFVCETYSNSVRIECPDLLDESIIELALPFSFEKCLDLGSSIQEFGPITPAAIFRVREYHACRIAMIPCILGHTHLLHGRFARKGREGRSSRRIIRHGSTFIFPKWEIKRCRRFWSVMQRGARVIPLDPLPAPRLSLHCHQCLRWRCVWRSEPAFRQLCPSLVFARRAACVRPWRPQDAQYP